MTDLIWRLHPENAVADLVDRVKAPQLAVNERERMLTALAFINTKEAASAVLGVAVDQKSDLKDQAAYWLSFRQGNDWFSLLNWSKINLNTAYERKLAAMKVKLQVILDERQADQERRWKAQEMVGDSVGGQLLIGMLAENKLPAVVLPIVEENIFKNPDLSVRVQAGKYVKRKTSDRTLSIDAIAALKGDANSGKTIFLQSCSTCHRVGETGKAIGPELTSIAKKFDKISLLDAIVNPGGAIVFGYEPWLVNTKDGGSVYGFLLSENKNTLVIKDIAGAKHVIEIDKISSKKKQEGSLMPDPAALGLTEKQLADIVEYLGE
jgi:putative heme-binding domain-containing protein